MTGEEGGAPPRLVTAPQISFVTSSMDSSMSRGRANGLSSPYVIFESCLIHSGPKNEPLAPRANHVSYHRQAQPFVGGSRTVDFIPLHLPSPRFSGAFSSGPLSAVPQRNRADERRRAASCRELICSFNRLQLRFVWGHAIEEAKNAEDPLCCRAAQRLRLFQYLRRMH